MRLDPSLASMGLYFKRENPVGETLVARYLKEPGSPFEWDAIGQDEFNRLRRNLVGTGFVAQAPDVAKVADQFVDTVVTLQLLSALAHCAVSPPDEVVHPSFDMNSQVGFFHWAASALDGVVITEQMNDTLFLASCSILETSDTFRKLDLMDRILETVKGHEPLEKAFTGGERTPEFSPGM